MIMMVAVVQPKSEKLMTYESKSLLWHKTMKYNRFTFKDDKLLCWRLGPINAGKQAHFSKDVESAAGAGTHKPPTSRGIWAFPYPHYDLFFCFHQWKKHLPKKYQDDSIERTEEDFAEIDRLIKEIKRKFPPSTFWTDAFYSHIFPNGRTDYNDWFYWNSVRDWAKVANKLLISYQRWNDDLFTCRYSKDHLEIFVPNQS
jgi:hypothetical protein